MVNDIVCQLSDYLCTHLLQLQEVSQSPMKTYSVSTMENFSMMLSLISILSKCVCRCYHCFFFCFFVYKLKCHTMISQWTTFWISLQLSRNLSIHTQYLSLINGIVKNIFSQDIFEVIVILHFADTCTQRSCQQKVNCAHTSSVHSFTAVSPRSQNEVTRRISLSREYIRMTTLCMSSIMTTLRMSSIITLCMSCHDNLMYECYHDNLMCEFYHNNLMYECCHDNLMYELSWQPYEWVLSWQPYVWVVMTTLCMSSIMTTLCMSSIMTMTALCVSCHNNLEICPPKKNYNCFQFLMEKIPMIIKLCQASSDNQTEMLW